MLARLYEAHYLEGCRIADETILLDLAEEIGLNRSAFSEAFHSLHSEAVHAHFADSREFLAQSGGRGFPTFVLEHDGALQRLDHTPFLGKPEAWANALESMTVSELQPEVRTKG